jgi:hypothetical protein
MCGEFTMITYERPLRVWKTGFVKVIHNWYGVAAGTHENIAFSVSYDRGSSLGMFEQPACDNSVLPDTYLINYF